MTLFASATKSSLFVLFFALLCFSALAREYSIVGYTPEDLTCIDKVINLFESWVSKHGKFYDILEEKLHRLEILKDNLKHIDETNKKLSNYWLGLNEFADLSHEEFKIMFLGLKGGLCSWTYHGSCWAFSTVAAVEGINQIVTGNFTKLSEQELIDCDTSFNNGCNRGTCDEKKDVSVRVTISGYHDVPRNNENSFLKALAHLPISVAIDVSGRDFQFYSGGVGDYLSKTSGKELLDIKHNLAYVCVDGNEANVSEVRYELPDGQVIKLEEECIISLEVFFDPKVIGIDCVDGLPDAIMDTMKKITYTEETNSTHCFKWRIKKLLIFPNTIEGGTQRTSS
ncbi:cysteine protease XCP1-like protein [Tanacetum coccineum]